MTRRLVFAEVAVAVLTVLVPATVHVAGAARVEIDAIAVDNRGDFVRGLTKSDFLIQEDGRATTIDSVEEVSSADDANQSRFIVLLLDDTNPSPRFISTAQKIANMFLSKARAGDTIDVVRLNRADDVGGDRTLAVSRIADYPAAMMHVGGRQILETVLAKVTNISQRAANQQRRTVIVGIGAINFVEPRWSRELSDVWPNWVAALTAASRGSVSVYQIDPAGVTGDLKVSSSIGLVALTGGEAFINSDAYEHAVQRIWDETGNYYRLGYTPEPNSSVRPLHDVKVSVRRAGVHVRARQRAAD